MAALLSIGSIAVRDTTTEIAVFDSEAELKDAVRGRLLAGWPAPFIADFPQISVQDKIGPEDAFRPAPAAATYAFWYVAASLGFAIMRAIRQRRPVKKRRRARSASRSATEASSQRGGA